MIPYYDSGAVFWFMIQSSVMVYTAYVGLILMAASAAMLFSYKESRLPSLIMAAVGSLALFPSVWFLCLYYICFADMNIRILVAALLTALIVCYDITVIGKFIRQKKIRSSEHK